MDYETDLLVLLINNPSLIDTLQIKPDYMLQRDNRIMLNAFIKMYNQYKDISYEYLKNFVRADDLEHFLNVYTDLVTNELYINSNIQEKFEFIQRELLENYKDCYRKQINKDYMEGKMSYQDSKEKLNKVDEFQINTSTQVITQQELANNIKISKVGIEFKNFNKLNKSLKLLQNDLLIVGATTGVGKSGFLLNIMNDLMDRYQCIYFNIEMSKATIYRRLIAINKDIPVNCIDNPTNYQDQLINNATQEIASNEIIIEHQKSDVKEIRSVIAKMKNKNKHTIIFIDHIGLLRLNENKKSLYEQSTEIVKQLRSICLEYDCTMICASQLNRTAYNSDHIGLQMLKDSGEVENSARKVILIYKEQSDNPEDLEPTMNIDIAKNDTGMTGIIKMKYFKVKQIFQEI